jgi:molecular chaperone GrpE
METGVKTAENPVSKEKKPPSLEEKTAELTELLQRTRAEFENYQKRVEREKQAVWLLGQAETLQKILPVWDSFEHALEKGNENEKKALQPIARQFFETMKKIGVQPMETGGKKFDSNLHDCLLVENNPKQPDGIVLEELHKGFVWNGQVLRHAKVKVNKIEAKPIEEKNQSKTETPQQKK